MIMRSTRQTPCRSACTKEFLSGWYIFHPIEHNVAAKVTLDQQVAKKKLQGKLRVKHLSF